MAIALVFSIVCVFAPMSYLLYRAMTDNDKPEDSSIFNKF